ncbi:MAG: hypothetical protein Q9163_001977 [Psora crenata]
MSLPRRQGSSPPKKHSRESFYRDSLSQKPRPRDIEAAPYADSPPRTPSRKPRQQAYIQPDLSPPKIEHTDEDPIVGVQGVGTELGRKRSLIRPERRRMDRDHPNFHYRQHAQNMEVLPSTTGNDPILEDRDEADTLMFDEKARGEAGARNNGDESPPRGRQREMGPVVGSDTKKLKRKGERKQKRTMSVGEKQRQKELDAVRPPSLWNVYCAMITFWCPGAILRCFGKPAKAQQRAWREKMGLISIILLICAFVGFLTFGFTQAVCAQPGLRLKANHVDGGYMIFHGSAYNLDGSRHPAARGILQDQNVLYDLPDRYGGMDGSFMFQNVNGACKDVITLAPGSDVPTNENGDLAWYFPCTAFNQDGSSKPNLTIPYYLGYSCHTTVNSRKAFYSLRSAGEVFYTWDDIRNSSRNLLVYSGSVLDLDLLEWFNKSQVAYPSQFDDLRQNAAVKGIDITHAFQSGPHRRLGQCLTEIVRVGSIDTETIGCIASKVVLYVSLVFILAIVLSKFLLALMFQWFFSRRFAASTSSTKTDSKKRNQQIEDWSDDIYRPPPRFTDSGIALSDKSSKRSSAFLPTTSRFTSPYASAALAKRRPAPTTMASQSSTNRLLRPTSMFQHGDGSELTLPGFDAPNRLSLAASRSSVMFSSPDRRFSTALGDSEQGPAGFIHEAVVPQPPPEWEPFGYPLAHTICLVTAYSEGYEGLRTTLDSIAMTEYPNSHKAILVVCDGLIKGQGEELTTPEIALSMMGDHTILPDEVQAFSYVAVASGSKRHNMAKVYSGFYDYGEDSSIPLNKQQRVPMMVVVKCGTPDEAKGRKPGNRGKRDSQIILMSFLQKVMFDERMTELEYEMFNGLWRVTGISPDFYEIVLMVDADTKVFPDSITHMVSAMVKDPEIMGLCGETKIANKRASWVSMIQVFEYFISHHLSKSFESVFGGVTCLPGCFCMYRIKAPKGGQNYWVPILANPDVVEHYSENVVDTLHKKNLLLLGEDRYLSTLMLKTFPKRKQVFVPQGVCKTTVPEEFRVLLSQRRRWINSTVHNLMELVLVRDLCGTFCFSMQFVVFIELVGTLVLPAAITFTFYLIIISIVKKPVPVIPLVLLALILGLPAVLIVLTAHRWSYVLWMLVYLLSLPIWNFVLPAYAYWKFDDFSWGDTRKTAGEKTKKAGIEYEGEFDSSKITMKRWGDFEKALAMSQAQELLIESESDDGGVPLPMSNLLGYMGELMESGIPPGDPVSEGSDAMESQYTASTLLDQSATLLPANNLSQTLPPDPDAAGLSSEPLVLGAEDDEANMNPWAESEDAPNPWNPSPAWESPADPLSVEPLHSAVQAASEGEGPFEIEVSTSPLPSSDATSAETLLIEADLFDDINYNSTALPGVAHSAQPILEVDQLNYPVETMFAFWRLMWSQQKPGYPRISMLAEHRAPNLRPEKVTQSALAKLKCDLQGIYWSRYQVTKEQAREVRRMSYKNHVNMNTLIEQERKDWGSEAYKADFSSPSSPVIPNTENYFSFRETNTKYIPSFRHYQLRHNIFAASQNAIYYKKGGNNSPYLDPSTNLLHNYRNFTITCYNPQSDTEEIVMNPSKIKDKNAPILDQISTLCAEHGILVVGSMSGVYGMKLLSTTNNTPITVGAITPGDEGMVSDNSTNHIHTILSRQSGLPQAVFNSNDQYIRVLDCTTNKWVEKHRFNSAVNCSVTDPSGRLRLLVSDDPWPVVADADTGEQLAMLPGHTDHGFACAWAPDGITMATGHQDGIVQIWDARQLKEAVVRIPAEQSGVRAMQFSPLGSGKPVLVLAEPADFVHVVDADTWASKQTIEFFGEIAGITITPDGRSLYVANADPGFGGLMEFERTGMQSMIARRSPRRRLVRDDLDEVLESVGVGDAGMKEGVRSAWRKEYADWASPSGVDGDPRCLSARGQRLRRHMSLVNLLI